MDNLWLGGHMSVHVHDTSGSRCVMGVSPSRRGERKAAAPLCFAVYIFLWERDHKKQACDGIHQLETFRNVFFFSSFFSASVRIKKLLCVVQSAEMKDRISDLPGCVLNGTIFTSVLQLYTNCVHRFPICLQHQAHCSPWCVDLLSVYMISPGVTFSMTAQPNLKPWWRSYWVVLDADNPLK